MASTRGELFAGVTVAIVTPFKGGEIDWDDLGKLVDWHAEQGTDALAPCGTTGESPTLDHDEHERVVAFVCEKARGRLKVMAGTGSNATREAIRMTKAAKKAGAHGTLQVGPYYNKPTQEGYFRHFAAIADACDLPQVIYNIPGRTGSEGAAEAIPRLAEAYPSVGGGGVVSVVGNVVPRDMMALVKAFDAGRVDEARRWHRKLFPLCRDML